MAKYLRLGADPSVEKWTLPDDADVEQIQKELDDAMSKGRSARIRVLVDAAHAADLLVNGKALPWAMVWEVRPGEPKFSIID